MKCDICHDRPAVIFVQQVSRGNSVELHLCEHCARERGFSTDANRVDISLGGIFSGLSEGKNEAEDTGPACPTCGCTLQAIKRTKRVGCADCYARFKAEIVTLLRQEGIEAAMPVPTQDSGEAKTGGSVDPAALRRELQRAIDQENYELAAYYRDRLRSFGEAT